MKKLLILLGALACASSQTPSATSASPATPAQLPRGDVELATFAPSLNVHLDSMTRRPSGMYLQNLVAGTGAVARVGTSAVVRYAGYLADGKLFDGGDASSEITVQLGSNQTIRGWEEGLPG